MLVNSNRASYRRLLALKHINELPAYFFISCKRNDRSHLKTVLISLRKDHLVPRPGE